MGWRASAVAFDMAEIKPGTEGKKRKQEVVDARWVYLIRKAVFEGGKGVKAGNRPGGLFSSSPTRTSGSPSEPIRSRLFQYYTPTAVNTELPRQVLMPKPSCRPRNNIFSHLPPS